MKKRVLIIITMIITILLAVTALIIGNMLNNQQNQSPEPAAAAPAYCYKTGENFAKPVGEFDPASANQRAAELNMGYSLFIALDPSQYPFIRDAIKEAINNGLTPILRICVQDSCDAFLDSADYINLLTQLSNDSQITGDFYAIAGPNEPLEEVWLGYPNDPLNNWPQAAPIVTTYMNEVIAGAGNLPKVKLISPVFNSTNDRIDEFINAMTSNGANWDGLDAIGLNAYNVTGYSVTEGPLETTTAQLERIKNLLPGRQYIITETGMYESERNTDPIKSTPDVPHNQALDNFRDQVTLLRNDPSVLGFLIFNSFGLNEDSRFQYNVMTNADYEYVLGSECIGTDTAGTNTPTPATCPSNINPEFWYGCPGNPSPGCNDIDGWLAGNDIPDTLPNGTDIDGNCFANFGAFENAEAILTRDGQQVASSNTMELRDYILDQTGTYVLECRSTQIANCSATDSFTVSTLTGDTPTPTPTTGSSQCPDNLATVFVLDTVVSDLNADITIDLNDVTDIEVAATTDLGVSFNQFTGELRVTGDAQATFPGNATSLIPKPYAQSDEYFVTAYVENEECTGTTSSLRINTAGTTSTPTPTDTVTTNTPSPTVFTTNPPQNTPIPTSIIQPTIIPNTAFDDSTTLKIILGITLFLIGTWFFFASEDSRNKNIDKI